MNEHLIILDLCCGSGAWSEPYYDAGYTVKFIDIERGTDVRLYEPPRKVHGVLAAPPCTMFASSGACRQRTEQEIISALSIVDACMRIIKVTNPVWWALENPVGTLRKYLGTPTLIFNPCDYGDDYTKKTLLWGDFTIPKASPTVPTQGSKMNTKIRDPKKRAETSFCFASAFFEANT